MGLHVPTQSETWVPARSARFGASWPVPGGDDLSQLATEATPELASLRLLLVAGPEEFPGDGPGKTTRWHAFFTTLGLTSRLPIREAVDSRSISGRHLTTDRITGEGIPDRVPAGVMEQWREG